MKKRALVFGMKPNGKVGILRDDGVVDLPDDPVESLRAEMEHALQASQRELDTVRLEREHLKLVHDRLQAEKDHMNRRNFSFDPATADTISPNAETMCATVDGICQLRGWDNADVSKRRAALLEAMRQRPDVSLTAGDVAAIISGSQRNQTNNALRVQPTSPPGAPSYPVSGSRPNPLSNQSQHAPPYRLSEDDIRATAQDAADFALAKASGFSRASMSEMAAQYGSAARVTRMLAICRERDLNPARQGDLARAEQLLFAEARSTVANAATQTECLYAIAARDGLDFERRPSDRAIAARVMLAEREDLCSAYGSPEPVLLRLSEQDKLKQFDEELVAIMVTDGLDPYDASSRKRACEKLAVRRPDLVPGYGWGGRR